MQHLNEELIKSFDPFIQNRIRTILNNLENPPQLPVTVQLPIEKKIEHVEATWKELHNYVPTFDLKKNENWMNYFTHRIRSHGCSCKNHWKKILTDNPPDWNNFFEWSVKAHNLVNKRLNKPEISLTQAQAIWQNNKHE